MILYFKLILFLFFNITLILKPFDLISSIPSTIDFQEKLFEKSIEKKLPKSNKRYQKNSRRNKSRMS
jgi:hypothetical protein